MPTSPSRPSPAATVRRAGVPADPEQHAQRIANAIDAAWSGHHGTGTDLHIPLSAAAALALCGRKDPSGPDPAELIAGLSPDGLTGHLRNVWGAFLIARPDLATRVMPLASWLLDDPTNWQREGAHAAARAALRAGVMDLTHDPDRRRNTDLPGAVLQTLRSHRSKAGRGAFYTPQPVAELIGNITTGEMLTADLAGLPGREAGASIMEPAAGTGAMLCGAARSLRRHGKDPAGFTWYANDIDPLAAAGLAVNVHLWGLGLNVVIGCGDGLDLGWIERALRDRNDGVIGLQVARLTALLQPLAARQDGAAAS